LPTLKTKPFKSKNKQEENKFPSHTYLLKFSRALHAFIKIGLSLIKKKLNKIKKNKETEFSFTSIPMVNVSLQAPLIGF
jgi:hypothetical protein